MRFDVVCRLRLSFRILLSMVIFALALMGVDHACAAGLEKPQNSAAALPGANGANSAVVDCVSDIGASPFIPVDSWVYPAMLRLYSLGYLDRVFLDMRPWTRASIGHMLENVHDRLEMESSAQADDRFDEASQIFDSLVDEIHYDVSTRVQS